MFPVIDVSPVWQQTLPGTDFKDSKQVLESLNIAFPGEENNDMFFTIWHGVNNKNTRELTYASGGHPPARLSSVNSNATLLRTPGHVIGGMSDVTYEKRECLVGERDRLYIFPMECMRLKNQMVRCGDFKNLQNL